MWEIGWLFKYTVGGKQLPYGERGFPGYPSFSDGIDRWDRERVNYDRDNPGFSESTGHFT
ncbi:hypothetical protein BGZ57DRAFT_863588 [Hyaloscypha finlandica]|nr:hypothetical protein BGZ57DRAFT_863588 [Hyaloscypha finlandica]